MLEVEETNCVFFEMQEKFSIICPLTIGFTSKQATNNGVLLGGAALLGSGNTAVLFELTFFSRQCVKGCHWHFTLIHLKR